MGWVEKRIDALKRGRKLTWIERRMLEHANPVHLFLLLIAAVVLVTGLWENNVSYSLVGLAIALLGHVYCWMQK